MCRAVGIIIAVITLKFVIPDIWNAAEGALLQFFITLQRALAYTPQEFMQGNVVSFPKIPIR